ncbi:MAG: hypothetical protein AMXMBFR61_16730 [Fimbriimonadales bacterium]
MRIVHLLVATTMATSALADYDLDASKWSQNGLADVHFTSILYSFDQYNNPYSSSCATSSPFEDDGNPTTLGMTINVGELTGGLVDYTFVATGTLNPVTGAYNVSHSETGLHIEFDVYVPDLGTTLTFVLTSVDQTVAGTVSGHSTCFIGGRWRDPGETMTTNPSQTRATYRGYIKTLFNPPWTLVVDNVRGTGAKCECPGVNISGRINLQFYGGSISGLVAEMQVRNGITTESFNVPLAPDGSYSVTTHIPGSVEVLAKVSHWLRGKVTGVNTNGGDVGGVDFSLVNGDVDMDNAVTLTDLNGVLVRFGSTSSVGDLDGSGFVGLEDLNIVLINFSAQGES